MAIKLLSLIEHENAGRSTAVRIERSVVADALTVADGMLLQVWDAPERSAASQFLVVRNPPDISSLAEVVVETGLVLDSVVPVLSAEPADDPVISEQRVVDALPETFPATLLSPAPIGLSGIISPHYGLAMCPTCGGWGGHLYQHP